MLLSKQTMKKDHTDIDVTNYTVKMLGQLQDIAVTSLSLNEKKAILDIVNVESGSVTLVLQHYDSDKYKIAHKVHCQLSHPHGNKLLDLVNKTGVGNDAQTKYEFIREVSKNCNVCKQYRRPAALPAVGMPVATIFNEVVAMYIKFLNG